MKSIDIKIFGFLLTIIGAFFFINSYFELDINVWIYSSIIIGLSSLNSVYNSFKEHNRGLLIWGTLSFLISIIVFLISAFEIISFSNLILPAIFLITSILFLMFFIDNTSVKSFIAISGVSFLIGIGIMFFKDSFIINQLNQYTNIAFQYPYIIILIIAMVLITKKEM